MLPLSQVAELKITHMKKLKSVIPLQSMSSPTKGIQSSILGINIMRRTALLKIPNETKGTQILKQTENNAKLTEVF